MFKRIKKLLGLAPKKEPRPIFVETGDTALMEAWLAGKPCYAITDSKGRLILKRVEDDK